MTKHNLEANLTTAKRELDAIDRRLYDELEAARVKIESSFSDQIRYARIRVNEAEKELQDYAVANATHPLLGKKVTRTDYRRGSFGSAKYAQVQIFGLCEVFTPSTPRKAGRCYHSPGDIVVRVLKKDGKPGLTIEAVKNWSACDGI